MHNCKEFDAIANAMLPGLESEF